MCFSLQWFEQLCIMIVIIMALWAIIKLFLPYLLQFLPDVVVQIIRIVVWAVLAIVCIYIIFGLLSCLLGAGGGLMRFPH